MRTALAVKAPTGHKSITLPEISELKSKLLKYPPISLCFLLYSKYLSISTPAISDPKRTQRVQ
jgi:hypothetical protein